MSAISSIASANAQLHHDVSIAVARKAQDNTKSQGDAMVSLIQAAADVQQQQLNSSSGGHIGTLLDTVG